MSFSTLSTNILYDGNGVDTTFEIPFKYVDEAHIKVRLYDVTNPDEPAEEELVRDVDWRFMDEDTIQLIEIQLVEGEPTAVPVPAATHEQVYIYRDTIDHHPTNYAGYSFPPATISYDFDRVYQRMQELRDEVARAIKLSQKAISEGEIPPNADEILKDLEKLSVLVTEGEVGDFLEKGEEDIEWKSGAFSGYSARFGEQFDSTGLHDTLLKILKFQYTPAAISLSVSPGTSVREKGTIVPSVTLTATTTKRSEDIVTVEFYGSGLIHTVASPNPAGGTEQYTDNTPFSDTKSFYARVFDGTSWSTSNTATYTFVYPYYSGTGAQGLSSGVVGTMTKDIRVSTASLNKTFTAVSGQVFYFAYPSAYGSLTSILDENGFETIGDWILREETITGVDASAQAYHIYEFKNPVVAVTTNFTFRR